MIQTGIVKEILYDKNRIMVRVPIFETAADKPIVLECRVLNTPGILEGYNPNDKVYVDFENNDLSYPIVLGKVLKSETKNSPAKAELSGLEVQDQAVLPKNTKIGDITYDLLYEMVKGSAESIEEIKALKNVTTNEISAAERAAAGDTSEDTLNAANNYTRKVEVALEALTDTVQGLKSWLETLLYPSFAEDKEYITKSYYKDGQIQISYKLKSINKEADKKEQYIGLTIAFIPHICGVHSLNNTKTPFSTLDSKVYLGKSDSTEKECKTDWFDWNVNKSSFMQNDNISNENVIFNFNGGYNKYHLMNKVLPDKMIITVGLYTDKNLTTISPGTKTKSVTLYNTIDSGSAMTLLKQNITNYKDWTNNTSVVGFDVRKVSNTASSELSDSSLLQYHYNNGNYDWWLIPKINWGTTLSAKSTNISEQSLIYIDVYAKFKYLQYNPSDIQSEYGWDKSAYKTVWVQNSGLISRQNGLEDASGRISILKDARASDGSPLSEDIKKCLTGFMKWQKTYPISSDTSSPTRTVTYISTKDTAIIEEIYADYFVINNKDNYNQRSFINTLHTTSKDSLPEGNKLTYDSFYYSQNSNRPLQKIDQDSLDKFKQLNNTEQPKEPTEDVKVNWKQFKAKLSSAVTSFKLGIISYPLTINNQQYQLFKPSYNITIDTNGLKLTDEDMKQYFPIPSSYDPSDVEGNKVITLAIRLRFKSKLRPFFYIPEDNTYSDYSKSGFYTKQDAAIEISKFKEVDRELFTSVQNNYSSIISSKLAGREKISTDNIYCFIPIYETLDKVHDDNIKSYRKLQNAFLPTSQIVLSTSKEDYEFTKISNRTFTAELSQDLFNLGLTEKDTISINGKELPLYDLPKLATSDIFAKFKEDLSGNLNKFAEITLVSADFVRVSGRAFLNANNNYVETQALDSGVVVDSKGGKPVITTGLLEVADEGVLANIVDYQNIDGKIGKVLKINFTTPENCQDSLQTIIEKR